MDKSSNLFHGVKNTSITILMPTFNDWYSLLFLIPKLDDILKPLQVKVQVVIIDDGSTEFFGKEKIHNLKLSCIHAIREIVLIRNQGNQRAIAIGIGYVVENLPSDFLVVMDSDHEDKPEELTNLINECLQYDQKKVIFAERTVRSEGLLFRIMYKLYKTIFRIATGKKISFGNFCIIPRRHIKSIANIPEIFNHFSIGVMRSRIPFEKIPTVRGRRVSGKSSMNFINLLAHAFNGFSVYSDIIAIRLLILAFFSGLFIVGTSIVMILLWFFTNVPLQGWTSVIIGIMVIILLQISGFAIFLNFMVALGRLKAPLIPGKFFDNYILYSQDL